MKSNDHHSTWNSFSKITDGPTAATHVLQLDGNSFLYTNEANRLFKGSIGNDGVVTLDPKDIAGTNITNVTETSNGYFMNTGWEGALVDRQGNKKSMPKTDAYRNLTYGASSQNELWALLRPKDLHI